MKKIIVTLMLLAVVSFTFGQRLPVQQQSKEFYLQKAERQTKAGWVLLGVGTVGIVSGIILSSQKPDTDEIYSNENIAGYVLLIGGIGLDLCSIPLFVSASNNRKRAATISVGLQNSAPLPRSPFTASVQPAVILRINL
jgi:hypothetical protein